jgi:hypothetical protein
VQGNTAKMPLHQFDYLFAIGTIFAALDAWNIGEQLVQALSLEVYKVLTRLVLQVPMMSPTRGRRRSHPSRLPTSKP